VGARRVASVAEGATWRAPALGDPAPELQTMAVACPRFESAEQEQDRDSTRAHSLGTRSSRRPLERGGAGQDIEDLQRQDVAACLRGLNCGSALQ